MITSTSPHVLAILWINKTRLTAWELAPRAPEAVSVWAPTVPELPRLRRLKKFKPQKAGQQWCIGKKTDSLSLTYDKCWRRHWILQHKSRGGGIHLEVVHYSCPSRISALAGFNQR